MDILEHPQITRAQLTGYPNLPKQHLCDSCGEPPESFDKFYIIEGMQICWRCVKDGEESVETLND